MQNVMTVDEAAHYLRKSAHTIREWIKHGRLPARKVGKSYLITEESVRVLIEPAPVTKETVTKSRLQIRRIKEFVTAMSGSGLTLDILEKMQQYEADTECRTLKDLGIE